MDLLSFLRQNVIWKLYEEASIQNLPMTHPCSSESSSGETFQLGPSEAQLGAPACAISARWHPLCLPRSCCFRGLHGCGFPSPVLVATQNDAHLKMSENINGCVWILEAPCCQIDKRVPEFRYSTQMMSTKRSIIKKIYLPNIWQYMERTCVQNTTAGFVRTNTKTHCEICLLERKAQKHKFMTHLSPAERTFLLFDIRASKTAIYVRNTEQESRGKMSLVHVFPPWEVLWESQSLS